MATISNIVINIRGDNNGAKKAIAETREAAEHLEIAGHGSARAFGFLGRSITEVGEKAGGSFGEAAAGLGEMTSGLGEAIHGYHALDTVIEVATAAQAALNAITPAGWTLMAVGAIAAVGAYVTFSQHAETAAEKAKRLKEALGDLASQTGVAFERGATEKIKELKKNLDEAEKDHKWEAIGMVGGIAGAGLGYAYEQHAISAAKEELEKFNEAVKAHRQEIAGKKADTELDHVLETAQKLNKTPLEQFKEQLAASGRVANECAEAIKRFKESSDKIDFGKAQDELAALKKEISNEGQDKAQQLARDLAEKAIKTGDDRYAKLAGEAIALHQQTEAAKEAEKAAEKLKQTQEQLANKAKSLTESVSPLAKFRDEAKELDEMLKRNLISLSTYQLATNKARQDLLKKFESEAPKTMTGYLEYGSTQAAAELAKDQELQQQEQWAQQQLDALTQANDKHDKTNDLLGRFLGAKPMEHIINF